MQLIPLGRKGRICAIVDDDDVEWISKYRWIAQRSGNNWYAGTNQVPGVSRAWMHRLILRLSDPKIRVDHINHDGLDNRRSNLRLITPQQNRFNARPAIRAACASSFFGVFRNTSGKKNPWKAGINIGGRYQHIGCFRTEEDAARAYDSAALREHGPDAFLNFREETLCSSL